MLLYLVRHGERATKNYNSRPKLDKGLTPEGREQAELLAGRLQEERIHSLYSSDFPRALQTAQPIARKLGLKVEVRKAFGELDVGEWNGLKGEELEERMPGESKKWHSHPERYRFPGGEDLDEFRTRVMSALGKIIESERKRGRDRICIVTHEAMVRAVYCSLLPGVSLKDFHKLVIDKASVTVIETDGRRGDGRLVMLNDTRHLK